MPPGSGIPGARIVLSSLAGASGGGVPGPVMPSDAGEASHPTTPSAAIRTRTRIMVLLAACAERSAAVAVAAEHGPAARVAGGSVPLPAAVRRGTVVAAPPRAQPVAG